MKPEKLLSSVPVLDAHIDTLSKMLYHNDGKTAYGVPGGHVNLDRIAKGGVDTIIQVHWLRDRISFYSPLQECFKQYRLMLRTVERYPDRLAITTNSREVAAAHKAGKVALIPVIENGVALEGNLENLEILHRLGFREIGLVWQGRNEIGNGNFEKNPTVGGLSDFGIAVVGEMNRLGMLVDVSHLNEEGFWDVAEHCQGPFIATHSNARALCKNNRNLWDDQIVALSQADGVMGMNFAPHFVDDDMHKASLARVLDHVCHITNLVGTRHIGLGTDYDGIRSCPKGLPHYGAFPRLVGEMQKRGFKDDEVAGILGGNFLRVFKKVCG